jgi:hypothetical protein
MYVLTFTRISLYSSDFISYALHGAESFLRSWPVFAASQEIPHILWNPKVLYRTHKCPPPVTILSQLSPVPTTPSNFLKIHLNIILPSTSGSPHWPLSLRFPYQHPVHPSLLHQTRHMPRPSHSSRFNHPHNIGTLSLVILYFSTHVTVHS